MDNPSASNLSDEALIARLGIDDGSGDVRRLYTLSQLTELLGVTRQRIRAWLEAGLIQPTKSEHGVAYFDFQQVSSAKTLCDLARAGIKTERIRRSLEQLKAALRDIDKPLEQLAFLERNGDLVVRLEEGLVEPSGQLLLEFDQESAVVSIEPVSAAQWFQRGNQHEEEGSLEDALHAYRQALLVGGPVADTVFNLANVLYELNRKEEAGERFRQAVELDPGHAEAWNNLGVVLSELRKVDEAVLAFQRAIALQYVDAHYNLADLLESIGRRTEAQEHWRKCARLDPLGSRGKYARKMII